uniref:Uncharacterized protein n=1 Tax=Arundo donax TaxID=35708 RepID=A0A0A9C571_ARUDO
MTEDLSHPNQPHKEKNELYNLSIAPDYMI